MSWALVSLLAILVPSLAFAIYVANKRGDSESRSIRMYSDQIRITNEQREQIYDLESGLRSLVAKLESTERQRDELSARLVRAEIRANEAIGFLRERTAKEIVDAKSGGDAARVFNERLRDAYESLQADSAGAGDSSAGTVPPSGTANVDPAPRNGE